MKGGKQKDDEEAGWFWFEINTLLQAAILFFFVARYQV